MVGSKAKVVVKAKTSPLRGRSESPLTNPSNVPKKSQEKRSRTPKRGLFKKLLPRGSIPKDNNTNRLPPAPSSGGPQANSRGIRNRDRRRGIKESATQVSGASKLYPSASNEPTEKTTVNSKPRRCRAAGEESPTSVLPDDRASSGVMKSQSGNNVERGSKTNVQKAKKLHNESERDGFCRRVDYYDGQTISVDEVSTYEIGNYLGGGVAGVVYEGHRLRPLEEYPVRTGYAERIHENRDCGINDDVNGKNLLSVEHTVKNVNAETNEGCRIWCSTISDEDHMKGGFDDLKLELERMSKEKESFVKGNSLTEKDKTVAIKILNPVGFRLLSTSSCSSAVVVRKGQEMSPEVIKGLKPMTEEHVWWLVNPSSKNLRTLKREPSPLVVDRRDGAAVGTTFSESMRKGRSAREAVTRAELLDRGSPGRGLRLSLIAAYIEPSSGTLKELPLTRCIEIWGHTPFGTSEVEFEEMMDAIERVNAGLSPREEPPQESAEYDDPSPQALPFIENSGLCRATNATKKTVYCSGLNAYIAVSQVPPKYIRWLRQRRAATKEIRNMMRIGRHKNVVHLYEVLELIQESKSIMFLVLELVTGGELFDLISSNTAITSSPTDSTQELSEAEQVEYFMRKFFKELASGISYCHANGIAHRDLKPENLLVHNDTDKARTLKIADFGLSATFALNQKPMQYHSSHNQFSPIKNGGCDPVSPGPITGLSPLINKNFGSMLSILTCGSVDHITECFQPHPNVPGEPNCLQRMTSIVGSPHYVAPEIIYQSDGGKSKNNEMDELMGYDGTKADVWSAGVILYAMLFRSLPFGEDLLRCPRFQSFSKWYGEARKMGRRRRMDADASLRPIDEDDDPDDLGPQWFFPSKTSLESKDIIVAMLNPDPSLRLSIQQVLRHPWMLTEIITS